MSKQENKVTLYIATHNKTGKKYFGKTTRYFTEEDLQKNYHGSGVYWKKHLKKHGDDITMKIYGIYNLDENSSNYVKPVALKFSEENNIADNWNIWTNIIPENGLDGGRLNKNNHKAHVEKRKENNIEWHSEETKIKISLGNKGKELTQEHKDKIGSSNKGNKKSLEQIEYAINCRKEKSDIWHTEETKNKIGLGNKGKIRSDETKNKISESLLGREVPTDVKQKISDTMNSKLWKETTGKKAKEKLSKTMENMSKRYNIVNENGDIIAYSLTTKKCSEINPGFRRYFNKVMDSTKAKNRLKKLGLSQYFDCKFVII